MKRTRYLQIPLPQDDSYPAAQDGTPLNAQLFTDFLTVIDAYAELNGERVNVLTAEVYLLREKLRNRTNSLAFSIIFLALASIINTFL